MRQFSFTIYCEFGYRLSCNFQLVRVLCYKYKKKLNCPLIFESKFFQTRLIYSIHRKQKYKNMIVDLDEKIRNLN